MPASAIMSQPVPQRSVRPTTVDAPKPSSVLFKTSPPSKQPTASPDTGDGGHLVHGEMKQIICTLSGDSPPTVSPTKNVYIGQDTTVSSNGALIHTEPYPREV